MRKVIVDKCLDKSQTSNNIIFIMHSIGGYFNIIVLNHIAFVLTLISLSFLMMGIRINKKESNSKSIKMTSYINGIIFCVISIVFWILSMLHDLGYIASD